MTQAPPIIGWMAARIWASEMTAGSLPGRSTPDSSADAYASPKPGWAAQIPGVLGRPLRGVLGVVGQRPGGVLRIRGKGGKVREVAIAARLGELLVDEHARRALGRMGSGYRYAKPSSPWVFPGRQAGPMEPDSVGVALRRALGGSWSAHSLRHRFATKAYAASRDLLTLQDQLGHAKPETTARYAAIPAGAAEALVAAAAA